MFVSWRWISEMVDTDGVDPRTFVDRFILAVAEIEGVVEIGPGLEQVLVGKVVAVAPHPAADKLRLADVDLGVRGMVQVVCGAPDLAVGMVVPFVPPGVTLPSGIEVRDGEVRGVRSPGMLASEKDLGLSDEHAGLLQLDGCDAAPGTPLLDAVPIADVLYEIDNKSVTHRPDLWGHVGMAREVAALLERPLRLPSTEVVFGDAAPLAGGVTVAARADCPRYLAARFAGVAVAPSPVATRLRLRCLGVRPVSNVVDATNLVMLETGNPLHAFDARFVRGQTIAVRRATEGEALTTLDGVARRLTAEDVVIADGEGPVALAGIMGGGESEIRDSTTEVVLEAANFDGARIRKTSARLGLRSESSARFEKSLDPETAAFAARRFAVVLQQLCPGATVVSRLVDVGPHAEAPRPLPVIHTHRAYLRQRLGLSEQLLPDAAVDATLGRLGFGVDGGSGQPIAVTVPSFRAGRDVGMVDDLVEELGRQYGYDRVPSSTMLAPAVPAPLPPMRRLERAMRSVCALGRGLHEVHQYSFDHEPTRSRLGLQSRDAAGAELPRLHLRNTLSSEHVALRRDVASGLLAALERNLAHGGKRDLAQKGLRVGLFELGRAYLPEQIGPDGPDLGVPAPLRASASAGDRARYLELLGPALAADAEAAAARATPLPLEPRRLAIAIGERLGGGEGAAPPAAVSSALWRQAVGAVEAICAALGLAAPLLRAAHRADLDALTAERPASAVDAAPGWLHPARHALIVARPGDAAGPGDTLARGAAAVRVGVISMLHPQARRALEVEAEVVLVELDLDALLPLQARKRRAGRPPRLPGSAFDVTVPVRLDVGADLVRSRAEAALRAFAAGACEGAEILGSWQGETAAQVATHPRAVTLRLHLRRDDRSLTDAEIQAARAAVVQGLVDWQDGGALSPVEPMLAQRLGLVAGAGA